MFIRKKTLLKRDVTLDSMLVTYLAEAGFGSGDGGEGGVGRGEKRGGEARGGMCLYFLH